MIPHRHDDDRIDKYTGPYERWTFSEDLGRPFTFPAIRKGPSTHITALMEGEGMLESTEDLEVRIPPLWNDTPDVTPFAMWNRSVDPDGPTDAEDADLARCLNALSGTRYRLNMPIDPATWPATYDRDGTPDGWQRPKVRPSVIIGVIDDGLPFLHRAFRDADGDTRINLCWLQAARADDSAAVPFGREITGAQIEQLRAQYGKHELRAYQAAHAIDRDLPEVDTVLRHHATHGAHIAGIAAGNDPYVGASALPDDAAIIAVQLPNTIAWDTSGFGKEMMMLSAVEYIFERARRIARAFNCAEIPLVINFSYGWSANRHDGQSSFERAVEALITDRRKVQPCTELVMPTGNNFANDMHARFSGDDLVDGSVSFGWQLKPDDRTSSYLEIWLPPDSTPDGWTVTVTPPPGSPAGMQTCLPVSADAQLRGGDPRRFVEIEVGDKVIAQLSADKHQNTRWRVMLAVIPTAGNLGEGRRAPVGMWTVTVDTGTDPLCDGDHIDIWVQRDDDPTQLGTGGQQSYLVDLSRPTPPRVLAPPVLTPVRGFGCLNGIGTAPSVFRVAGYMQSTKKPVAYSGSASVALDSTGTPVVEANLPAATATADQGWFLSGLPSIGVLSGSGARIIGTSAAAATATRLIALNFAAGKAATDGFENLYPGTPPSALTLARTGPLRVPPVCASVPPQPGTTAARVS
ncbi:MAG: S8 family serine peptidase [Marivita sp.]|uniref:S8 family serine peptidase n=1 Tax=Marivita sp. TaxID=2003365 RepID=UPI0025C6277B|nr:S8 family serine peptidase [Marivita sp.]MCI5112460.1 S8 family serine peptidase [Marivita sp.]